MKSWHRQKDNIKLDLKERECESMDLIEVAQDVVRLRDPVYTVMKLQIL
jgi:hypothetical protein